MLEAPAQSTVPAELVLIENLADAPITSHLIATWTRCVFVLAKVFQFIQGGWPEQTYDDIHPYWLELSSQDDCVIWGGRVVIPPIGRERVA